MAEKTTTLTATAVVDELKGTCPRCGGPLILKDQVCARNPDGSPSEEDTFPTPYCGSCNLFWVPQKAEEWMMR